jgi:hypothetical protein
MSNLSARNRLLMREAIRRYYMFHGGEPLTMAWIGLGTAAFYRPAIDAGLMTFHDGRTPPKRCMGWFVLTDKGQSVFTSMVAAIVLEALNSSY